MMEVCVIKLHWKTTFFHAHFSNQIVFFCSVQHNCFPEVNRDVDCVANKDTWRWWTATWELVTSATSWAAAGRVSSEAEHNVDLDVKWNQERKIFVGVLHSPKFESHKFEPGLSGF